jgi:non-heme chloroperoxidase
MATVTVGTENSIPIDLHYTDHGAGRPVVLIHGWPLSGRSWEHQVPALIDAGYRVITYDRRGFGQSSQPWNGYDYDTFTTDLNAVLEHLDLNDVALVGFSMGGGEAVRYLARYGSAGRVTRAVLAAAVPPYLYKSEDNPDGGLDDATIEQFQDQVRTDRLAFLDDFTKNFYSPGAGLTGKKVLVSEPMRQYALAIAAAASPKGTLDCITAWARTDFRADVRAVGLPTLVIHGDSDQIVPLEISGRRTNEMINGSELVVIEGGPHGVTSTHSAQFNSALLDFLGK